MTAVPRSALVLAALATAAVPGLDVVDARPPQERGADFDTAVITDSSRRHWVVRAPRRPSAGAALESESVLLAELGTYADSGKLPFDVPKPEGFAHLPEGGRAVVHRRLPGRSLHLDRLAPGPGLSAQLGAAIAAIHELPPRLVEDAGLPVYDAETYRRRRLAEVDEAAKTGRVPAALLARWESSLEDVAWWRFQPVVTHGDLSAEHVLVVDGDIRGVINWADAKVADPADDLAWLLVTAPDDALDSILEAYTMGRKEQRDEHLVDRALLAGELALTRWLLHGVRNDVPEIIADAESMLADLAADLLASQEETDRIEREAKAERDAIMARAEAAARAASEGPAVRLDGADPLPTPGPEAELETQVIND